MRALREKAVEKGLAHEPGFRWRGAEVARIEGLSDAVFAFAVTLLVVSLEVPRTFDDLVGVMRGFPAFGVCFALLILIWHAQYKFFRRYGLQDTWTTTLNAALLFLVLFYTYPLKFLFSNLFEELLGWTDLHPDRPTFANLGQVRTLMLIYSTGFLAVFLVFVLLYRHAWRRRADLGLDPAEIYDTRSSIQHHAIFVAIALLSIGIAVFAPPRGLAWAGWIYALIGPVSAVHGSRRGEGRRRLLRKRQDA